MKNKMYNFILVILTVLIVSIIIYTILDKNNDFSFIINEDKVELKVDEEVSIDYSISNPKLKIIWQLNNPNVATITDNGIIKAKEEGTTIVTGTVNNKGISKSDTFYIKVKPKNYDVILEDIILPEGEILLKTNNTYTLPITYVPADGYVKDISFIAQDDSIISVQDGIIKALKPGYTSLSVTVNNKINKIITVNVTNNDIYDNVIKPLDTITFTNNNEVIYIGEDKIINYLKEPSDGVIFDTKWETSNDKIATVDEFGNVKGLEKGSTTLFLTVNNRIKKEINITIKTKVKSINLDYTPKQVLKVGEKIELHPKILPNDGIVYYESSNSKCLSISENGVITANNPGNATITIKSEDGNIKKTISYTVYKTKGLINSNTGIWAYSKDTDVIPKKADASFFSNLAKNGKGTYSNNTYIYKNYSYDVQNNLLTIDKNQKIYMRMYYPNDTDLSKLNTFTFIGGIGETNFGGYFKNILTNPAPLKSTGIIILIPENNSNKITSKKVVEATNFVKLIIDQNSNARNNIGGYSNGGPPIGDILKYGDYNKVVLINTSFYWVDTIKEAKDKEYVIYTAKNDTWRGTDSFINELYKVGVKDVTIVTNNINIANKYKDKYLVINPGNSMKNGHTSENLTLSHYFAFGCE